MSAIGISTKVNQIDRWSEPLVADYIFVEYERLLGENAEAAETMARQHCRMWRDLLGDEGRRAQFARRDLLRLARLTGVEVATIDSIDTTIFDALLDVILRRGHSSRDIARSDGHALMQAASTLGEIRHAA